MFKNPNQPDLADIDAALKFFFETSTTDRQNSVSRRGRDRVCKNNGQERSDHPDQNTQSHCEDEDNVIPEAWSKNLDPLHQMIFGNESASLVSNEEANNSTNSEGNDTSTEPQTEGDGASKSTEDVELEKRIENAVKAALRPYQECLNNLLGSKSSSPPPPKRSRNIESTDDKELKKADGHTTCNICGHDHPDADGSEHGNSLKSKAPVDKRVTKREQKVCKSNGGKKTRKAASKTKKSRR